MDSNTTNTQTIHIDPVQPLDGGLRVEDQEQFTLQDHNHIVQLILVWVVSVAVVVETLLTQDIHSMVTTEWQTLEVVVAVVVPSTLLILDLEVVLV